MHNQVWELIQKSHNITLTSHIEPDSDSLGSALALYPTLKNMKKSVTLFCATKPLAHRYDFLPNFKKIRDIFPKKCDLLISFDCGSFDRVGVTKGDYKIINIDHHKSNTLFGDINLVDESSPSTTLLVQKLIEYKEPISQNQAISIYTGLVEDTGFFTHQNTTKKSFDAASELLSYGVDPVEVAKNLKMRNSLANIRLTALFIDSIELIKDGQIGVGYITQDDFKKSGALRSDSDHLIDILRDLATVKVAILIMETDAKNVKISLRSKGEIDVSNIAKYFGGGGHKNASGFESLRVLVEEQINMILKRIENEI